MITLFVPGIPQPQGSKTRTQHGMREDNRNLAPWREAIVYAARAAYRGEPLDRPVLVDVVFTFGRPRSHYGTGRNSGQLKATAPSHVAVKPDLDKLQRAVGDALVAGGLLRDDNLIVCWCASKIYGDQPGALILIEPL